MTDKLMEDGYVASYNVPYNQRISDKLGYQQCKFVFYLDPYNY